MYTEYLQRLVGKLTAEAATIKEHTGSGGCSTFDEYQRSVGKILGLEQAKDIMEEALTSLEEEDL